MGILKVGAGALKSVLEDQWREYFYCPSMEADVLVKKGENRKSKRSYNTKGSDNLISNGSIIAVNEGQCMMIVDQGAIVEVCAEAGEFVYDTSAEPSIFYGNLGKSIGDSFKQFGKRFTMGGDTARDQRVYFFNTKEIVGNKYGTANAVPFRVVDQNIGLDMDIAIRCHGEYSYRMVDPILFYKNICGNIEEDYTRDKIDSQLRSELLTALQPAFAKISGMGVRYSALPGHTVELANALSAVLKHKNYSVDAVYNGIDAYNYAIAQDYDGIILDIMMPGMDGIQVLTKLREKGIDSPVLLLTAKSDIDDRITGLDSGADDYLTKPFAMGELLARIRAMTRRRTEFAPSTLTFGNVSLNRQSFELSGPNGSQKLGNKEFQMIEALMLNHGTLISTERFMEKIWGYDSDAEINVVWVYISYLRKKLGLIGADIEIKATRGVGYTLEEKHND